eukprot:TRINITY_DN2946_c0_g1_i1.p1 TRINITY_DN2946_c0_g1~~TRINITY_DN2946_c0_g1_i1.p1  ORF type:complete len:586 (+),score=196.37 TRINITY_DN2946_c0_g1_i1:151-1758(+)
MAQKQIQQEISRKNEEAEKEFKDRLKLQAQKRLYIHTEEFLDKISQVEEQITAENRELPVSPGNFSTPIIKGTKNVQDPDMMIESINQSAKKVHSSEIDLEKNLKSIDSVHAKIREQILAETQKNILERQHIRISKLKEESNKIEETKSLIKGSIGVDEETLRSLAQLEAQKFDQQSKLDYQKKDRELEFKRTSPVKSTTPKPKPIIDTTSENVSMVESNKTVSAEIVDDYVIHPEMLRRIDQLELELVKQGEEEEKLLRKQTLLESQVDILTSEKEELLQKIQSMSDLITKQVKELEFTKMELQSNETDKATLQSELDRLENEFEDRESKRRQGERKYRKDLKSSKNELKDALLEIERLKSENEEYSKQVGSLEMQKSTMNKKISDLEEEKINIKRVLLQELEEDKQIRTEVFRTVHFLVHETLRRVEPRKEIIFIQQSSDSLLPNQKFNDSIIPNTPKELLDGIELDKLNHQQLIEDSEDEDSFVLNGDESGMSDSALDDLHTSELEEGLSDIDLELENIPTDEILSDREDDL